MEFYDLSLHKVFRTPHHKEPSVMQQHLSILFNDFDLKYLQFDVTWCQQTESHIQTSGHLFSSSQDV